MSSWRRVWWHQIASQRLSASIGSIRAARQAGIAHPAERRDRESDARRCKRRRIERRHAERKLRELHRRGSRIEPERQA